MKRNYLLTCWLLAGGAGITQLHAQQSMQAAGGTATGPGGTATYSVGQLTTVVASGPGGTASPGVQQPLEISVVSASTPASALLECTTYPNPTAGNIALRVDAQLARDLTWAIQDISGRQLQSERVLGPLTAISLAGYPAGVYLLAVKNKTAPIKTFKIIKH